MNREGNLFEREVEGLLARCVQHEVDHLYGKLFIDYLSVLKRRAALAKWGIRREPGCRRTSASASTSAPSSSSRNLSGGWVECPTVRIST